MADDSAVKLFNSKLAWSAWLEKNHGKSAGLWLLALMAGGQMQPAGIAAIEQAKKNGRWDAAYASPRAATVPGDFQAALEASPRTATFFHRLDRANRYAILWRIQTVKKAETRARKIEQFVGMLEREEKIHP